VVHFLLHRVPSIAVMKTSQKWNSVTTALLVAITVIPIGVCYGKFIGTAFIVIIVTWES